MEQLGQYKILRKLGAGAMGEVYLAEHQLLKVMRALKVLPVELSASGSFRERFLKEGRVLASLRHPHIVQVHDMGVDDNVHYIAMEFVSPDGRQVWPLDRLLAKSCGRMQPGSVARVLLQVCEAIAYAHEQGVVHCDIKPSNILVVRNNEVCVSDFGLSKVLGQPYLNQSIKASLSSNIGLEMTQIPQKRIANDSMGSQDTLGGRSYARAESLVGTYHYMPPEVHEGGEWTPLGDIYSLGVLAYVMLTGKRPLGRWKAPSEVQQGISLDWDTMVNRLMAETPSERFQSVNELIRALQSIIQKIYSRMYPSNSAQPDSARINTEKPLIHSENRSGAQPLPPAVETIVQYFIDAHRGQWTIDDEIGLIFKICQMPEGVNISHESIVAVLNKESRRWQEEIQRKPESVKAKEEKTFSYCITSLANFGQIIQEYLPENDKCFQEGRIPPQKESNARKICGIYPGETIFFLIDCTIFGSAKNCIVFTSHALYCHNGLIASTTGRIRIPYSEFSDRPFSKSGITEVFLGHAQFLNIGASNFLIDQMLKILLRIKEWVVSNKKGHEPARSI